MKTFISSLFITIFGLVYSQTSNFTIGVLLPDATSKINESGISKLENKLINFLNKSQVFSYGYSNDFVLYPIIDITESGIVQGGLENLAVTKVDITFAIKQMSTGKMFGTATKTFKGSGKNESQAIANSFSQINPTDKILHEFLSKSKEDIVTYYSANCTKIIQNAERLAKSGDYEQSISLFQSIPDTGNSCYESAQKSSLANFKLYQKKLCSSNINKAKSEIALNNFEQAIYYLEFIDNESECYKESQSLITQISSKVTKKENQEIDMETKRINAIKEIGKTYYSNQARSIKYTVIVK